MKAKTALKAGAPGRSRLVGALVLLAAVVSLTGTSSARADEQLRLAYICGQHVCSIRSDGEDRRRLTDRRGVEDGSPAWSPDASRLAFTRRDDDGAGLSYIYIWRRADNAFIRLREGSDPAWSPDGRRLAYAGPRGISIMTRGGTVLRTGLADGSAPTWSPTGESLAYLKTGFRCPPEAYGDQPARAASPVCAGEQHLWAMTANGEDQRPLAESGFATGPPDWSPRRDEIVLAYDG